jgi:hypothetical protein
MTRRFVLALVLAGAIWAPAAAAQSIDLGVHVGGAHWSEFKGGDAGVGVRLGWKPVPVVGLEAEVNWYPGDFPDATVPFSDQRVEGLVAMTVGPKLGMFRPFVRVGTGRLRLAPASDLFACIAIFPPPLSCLLADGETLSTLEIGGGLEVSLPGSAFLRFDAGDRALKYPGPTLSGGARQDEAFVGHAVRFLLGGGWRF